MRKEMRAGAKAEKKPAAPQSAAPKGGPARNTPAPGEGALGQLLAQNNALLEQNMLLLNALLGAAQPQAGEKSVPADPEAGTEAEPEAMPAELPGFIPGVDMRRSLETYGGSVEIYHSILKTYRTDIREKEQALQELFDKRDTENFTIQVHALKSASRGVGAFDLGEDAYQLELAGKAGDWKTIEGLFPSFREALHRMVENTGAYVDKYLAEPEKAEGDFRERPDPALIRELRESCGQMDYLHAEKILAQLRESRYPDPLSRKLDELAACCSAYDYDQLDILVQELGEYES
jgi:HPt (histidine-containing phosphotransfer) domain-containing protein